MTAAVTKSRTTGPASLDDREAQQQQQRQRDELDPARQRRPARPPAAAARPRADRDRRSPRRGGAAAGRREAGPRLCGARSSPRAPEYGPCPTRSRASSSSATWSAASAAARCSRCCRGCASACGRRSSWSTPRTSRAASASRRRSPTSSSAAGVDVITLGNHAYHRKEIYPYLDAQDRIMRPANYLRSQPGRGWAIVERGGVRLGVVNLSGNLYLRAGRAGVHRDRRRAGPARGQGRPRPRRHPRRGDEREGGAWAGSSTAA